LKETKPSKRRGPINLAGPQQRIAKNTVRCDRPTVERSDDPTKTDTTGLLLHRWATTHWASLDLIAELDPTIDVRRDERFVDDGDIVTAAGVPAGPLYLATTRQDLITPVSLETRRDAEAG
jgi:hypothetical protein